MVSLKINFIKNDKVVQCVKVTASRIEYAIANAKHAMSLQELDYNAFAIIEIEVLDPTDDL